MDALSVMQGLKLMMEEFRGMAERMDELAKRKPAIPNERPIYLAHAKDYRDKADLLERAIWMIK